MARRADTATIAQAVVDGRAAELDGVWIGACTSTRIYCRPVCPAGAHVKQGNIQGFASAAQAEAAGYRPCLTCCPEAAPFPTAEGGFSQQAVAFAQSIQAGLANPDDAALLSCAYKAAGMDAQAGAEMVADQFAAEPLQYVRTARRLAAKKLMREGTPSLDDVADACGFANGEALSQEFKQAYKLDAAKLAAQRPRNPRIARGSQAAQAH